MNKNKIINKYSKILNEYVSTENKLLDCVNNLKYIRKIVIEKTNHKIIIGGMQNTK